jgi:hypothetical protein
MVDFDIYIAPTYILCSVVPFLLPFCERESWQGVTGVSRCSRCSSDGVPDFQSFLLTPP